jgi:hypothetical protein
LGFASSYGVLEFLEMPFPIKTCVICEEEFELKPDKPGYANRCPECSAEEVGTVTAGRIDTSDPEVNTARRRVIRDLLYQADR